MKTLITIQKFWLLPLFVVSALLFSSCSINDSETSTTEDLTEEELQIAGQIIAESLSDQRDGIFASLNDAFTLPSSNNFAQKQNSAETYSSALFNNANAGGDTSTESNYSYSYDPSSGVHLVSFSRSVNNPNMSKESTAELEYIYYSADDSFIASPRIENDRINTIDYAGQRSGSIITPQKSSSYQRSDQFFIDGLTGGAEILTIEGLHEGSGEFEIKRENGNVIERNYELTVEFINVEINNETIESNGNLQKGVTGALAYEMFITRSVNGNESLKTVNGTIEFNGDGTALLRFRNILEDFKINLEQGDILDDDRFEGFVRSVNTDDNTFTLFGGQTLLLTENSEINSNGDLLTLEEVERTLGNDIRVETRGSFGTDEAGTDIVGNVTFAYEREDVEFEDDIREVDLENNSFTLKNGTVLFMTDSTEIDDDGDLFSLEEVSVALQNGNNIEAEGEFIPGFDGTNSVIEVEFEYEDQEFEDYVESADASTQSFVLRNGTEIFTNENTKFDDDDLKSIEELVEALKRGYLVEAEGDFYYDSEDRMIAIEVELEIEDKDDDIDDREFEEIITDVNLSNNSFTLRNGMTLYMTGTSRIDSDSDLLSLEEVSEALDNGNNIEADGDYRVDSKNDNIVIEVEFEFEDQDFEDYVESANASTQSFMLRNGTEIFTNENTKFDDDLKSIEELVTALEEGFTVEADGEFYFDSDGRMVATEVDLEIDDDFDERDFEGYVQSVDLDNQSFTLTNNLVLHVNSQTKFEDDLKSLEELDRAISDGLTVEADGEYYIDNGRNIVIEVDLEIEDDFEERDFEGYVQSVNLTEQSFTLTNGLVLHVNSQTKFEDDLKSLEELDRAIRDGLTVEADGEYYIDNGRNIVIEVDLEIEDDFEERDFEGYVQSVNLTEQSFTLTDGLVLHVNSRTEFDDDLKSLEELNRAISDGLTVEADGEYYIDNGRNIVIEVDLEIEDDFEERDFEGYVQSVNLTEQSFTLTNGLVLHVNSRTEFDDDLKSLEELDRAISDGLTVEADGEYYIDNGRNIVIEVDLEIEDDDDNDDSEEREFEDIITGVNLSNNSFTLRNGMTFIMTGTSQIDSDGDLFSLEEVSEALDNGNNIEADGDYRRDSNSNNVVTEVEFEFEDQEFEDYVESASVSSQSFILRNGTEVFVNENTEFDDDDLESIEELVDALEQGYLVEADGDYYLDSEGRFIALEVELEIED